MDIATLLGIVGGAAMIVMSVLTSGGTLGGIIDIPSVFMTIGGSYFAMFIAAPLKKALGMFKIMAKAFKVPDFGEKNIVINMQALSEKARREGILALEDGLDDLEDPFMKMGLRLNNLEDKSSLGPNMAVALITTLYGSMMANWLITPFSTKLANQNSMEMRSKEMIIEGVLAIQAGENPRIMAQKLLTYLDPVTRKAIEADVLKD